MDIQNALQKLVTDHGMTDDEIGIQIGAPQSIVTRLRNGKHKSTSFERGSKILTLLESKKKAA